MVIDPDDELVVLRQGVVNAESGITYPNKGSMSSIPNDAGLAGKLIGGFLSTIETVPSAAQAHCQSQPELAVRPS